MYKAYSTDISILATQVAAMALNHTELAEMCGHLLAAPIIPDYVMTIIQVYTLDSRSRKG